MGRFGRNKGFSTIGGPSYMNVYHNPVLKGNGMTRSLSKSAVKRKPKREIREALDTDMGNTYHSNPPFKAADQKILDPLDAIVNSKDDFDKS
jgi:hypothetical protein